MNNPNLPLGVVDGFQHLWNGVPIVTDSEALTNLQLQHVPRPNGQRRGQCSLCPSGTPMWACLVVTQAHAHLGRQRMEQQTQLLVAQRLQLQQQQQTLQEAQAATETQRIVETLTELEPLAANSGFAQNVQYNFVKDMHKILGVSEYHLANLETSIASLANNARKQKVMANLEKTKLVHENGKLYLAAKGWYLRTCNLTEYGKDLPAKMMVLSGSAEQGAATGPLKDIMGRNYVRFMEKDPAERGLMRTQAIALLKSEKGSRRNNNNNNNKRKQKSKTGKPPAKKK
jgi:hypothetical protein